MALMALMAQMALMALMALREAQMLPQVTSGAGSDS